MLENNILKQKTCSIQLCYSAPCTCIYRKFISVVSFIYIYIYIYIHCMGVELTKNNLRDKQFLYDNRPGLLSYLVRDLLLTSFFFFFEDCGCYLETVASFKEMRLEQPKDPWDVCHYFTPPSDSTSSSNPEATCCHVDSWPNLIKI